MSDVISTLNGLFSQDKEIFEQCNNQIQLYINEKNFYDIILSILEKTDFNKQIYICTASLLSKWRINCWTLLEDEKKVDVIQRLQVLLINGNPAFEILLPIYCSTRSTFVVNDEISNGFFDHVYDILQCSEDVNVIYNMLSLYGKILINRCNFLSRNHVLYDEIYGSVLQPVVRILEMFLEVKSPVSFIIIGKCFDVINLLKLCLIPLPIIKNLFYFINIIKATMFTSEVDRTDQYFIMLKSVIYFLKKIPFDNVLYQDDQNYKNFVMSNNFSIAFDLITVFVQFEIDYKYLKREILSIFTQNSSFIRNFPREVNMNKFFIDCIKLSPLDMEEFYANPGCYVAETYPTSDKFVRYNIYSILTERCRQSEAYLQVLLNEDICEPLMYIVGSLHRYFHIYLLDEMLELFLENCFAKNHDIFELSTFLFMLSKVLNVDMYQKFRESIINILYMVLQNDSVVLLDSCFRLLRKITLTLDSDPSDICEKFIDKVVNVSANWPTTQAIKLLSCYAVRISQILPHNVLPIFQNILFCFNNMINEDYSEDLDSRVGETASILSHIIEIFKELVLCNEILVFFEQIFHTETNFYISSYLLLFKSFLTINQDSAKYITINIVNAIINNEVYKNSFHILIGFFENLINIYPNAFTDFGISDLFYNVCIDLLSKKSDLCNAASIGLCLLFQSVSTIDTSHILQETLMNSIKTVEAKFLIYSILISLELIPLDKAPVEEYIDYLRRSGNDNSSLNVKKLNGICLLRIMHENRALIPHLREMTESYLSHSTPAYALDTSIWPVNRLDYSELYNMCFSKLITK